MTSLSELGKRKAAPVPADDDGLDFGQAAAAVVAPRAIETGAEPRAIEPSKSNKPQTGMSAPLGEWPQIEVEAVVGGCLMRLHVTDMSPAQVLPWLKSLDPGVKVRDDFPKGGAGFGKKETKRARLMVITLKASDNGTFIDLVCKGESEVSVTVSKKRAGEFIGMLAGTQRVTDEHLDKLQGAMDNKGQATVILDGSEPVDVEYWTSDDGKAFMEALHAAAAD